MVALLLPGRMDPALAGLLVDLTTGEIELLAADGWTCRSAAGWRSDGEQFHFTVSNSTSYRYRQGVLQPGFAIDGLRTVKGYAVNHQLVVLRAGAGPPLAIRLFNSDVRRIISRSSTGPRHRAEWSPDQKWLAIGGEQNQSGDCHGDN